jgi:asparagine synthase (glutamine-hydrolysing)
MPGQCIEVQWTNGAFDLKERNYWTFTPPVEPVPIARDAALDLIDREIRRAVSSHMLADVEVGALLSGGVDSGAVVAVASEAASSRLRTFSIGFGSPDNDELPLARLVSERYRTVHSEEIVREDDFVASVDRILDVFDQPFADNSLVPTLAVSAVASKQVKVVLTGDGGDEAFGGYDLGVYISPFLRTGLWRKRRLDRS